MKKLKYLRIIKINEININIILKKKIIIIIKSKISA